MSAATQKRKDVVVLVDVSKNIDVKMTNELVTSFLKTLETRDKVLISIHIFLFFTGLGNYAYRFGCATFAPRLSKICSYYLGLFLTSFDFISSR